MVQQKINRVLFALDRSGSMHSIMKPAIAAFNENVKTIREQCRASGQAATVSLIIFDNEVEMLFFNRPIDSIVEIGPADILARDSTSLFDAVGSGIQQLLDLPVGKDEDVSYLVNIITDGAENSSRKFNSKKLGELMQRVQSTDVWTLSFLVPRGGRGMLVNHFGIPDGNVMEWEASAAGVKKYAAANAAGIQNYFQSRNAGQKSVKSFYTDLGNVSLSEVKKTLVDVSDETTVVDVDRDDEIKTFCERKFGSFKKGAAFYQLISGKENADKVQDYKKILIVEKGKQQVFGGDEVRHMLNLPDAETKVRPGDHGKFDIFIQSTSTNRKIKKGTKIIYRPSAAI